MLAEGSWSFFSVSVELLSEFTLSSCKVLAFSKVLDDSKIILDVVANAKDKLKATFLLKWAEFLFLFFFLSNI